MSRFHRIRSITIPVLLAAILLSAPACRGRGDRAGDDASNDNIAEEDLSSDLTFNNITLEQSDDEGKLQWRVNASQAVYTQDRQIARIEQPKGEFFRENEPALSFEAETGEIREDGEQLFLRGSVVATDTESGAVLKGDEVEWLTDENIVVIRNNVTGTHPDINIATEEAKVFIDEQRIELTGNIRAVSQSSGARLTADHLVWLVEEDRVVSDRPFRIQRIENRQVTEQASSDQGEFNLAQQVATLRQNSLIILQSPPLRVTGNALTWDVDNQTVVASQPITIVHREEQTTVRGDRGQGNLATNIFTLTGNVRANSQRNQARLTSNRLTWNAGTQNVEAEGDVNYQQVDPVLNLRGPRAVGKLEDQTIVVSGGRVVTEIVPEPN